MDQQFGIFAAIGIVLLASPVFAQDIAKQSGHSNASKSPAVVLPSKGQVTMPGSGEYYTPLSPAEAEKLGREGTKNKMREQRR